MLTQTGDYLTFDNSMTRQLQPMLATSWSHNGDGSVWTFKLRRGVKFHNGQPMSADDVVYTCQQQSDPKNAVKRALDLRGRAQARGRGQGRLRDGRVSSGGSERELPVHHLVGQLQPDHRPEGHRLREVAADIHRNRAVQAAEIHPEPGRRVRRQPRLLGGSAASGGNRVSVLRRPAAADPGTAGRAGRRRQPVHRAGRRGAAEQLELRHHQGQVCQSPRTVDAQ